MMGYGYSGIFMLIGGLVLIGVIVLVVYAVMHTTSVSGRTGYQVPPEAQRESSRRALEILSDRYAKGEISDEEYNQKKSELKKQ